MQSSFGSLLKTDYSNIWIRNKRLFLIDDNVIPAMPCHAQMQVGYHRYNAHCAKHENGDRTVRPKESKRVDMYKGCTSS